MINPWFIKVFCPYKFILVKIFHFLKNSVFEKQTAKASAVCVKNPSVGSTDFFVCLLMRVVSVSMGCLRKTRLSLPGAPIFTALHPFCTESVTRQHPVLPAGNFLPLRCFLSPLVIHMQLSLTCSEVLEQILWGELEGSVGDNRPFM